MARRQTDTRVECLKLQTGKDVPLPAHLKCHESVHGSDSHPTHERGVMLVEGMQSERDLFYQLVHPLREIACYLKNIRVRLALRFRQVRHGEANHLTFAGHSAHLCCGTPCPPCERRLARARLRRAALPNLPSRTCCFPTVGGGGCRAGAFPDREICTRRGFQS
jgi:hypothetical protein